MKKTKTKPHPYPDAVIDMEEDLLTEQHRIQAVLKFTNTFSCCIL